MLKNIGKFSILFLGFIWCVNSFAQSGFAYVEGNLGLANLYEKVAMAPKNFTSGLALNLNLGWQWQNRLGLEVSYSYLPQENFGWNIRGKDNYLVAMAMCGTVPLNNKVGLFAKFGPAIMHHTMCGYYLDGKRSNTGEQSVLVAMLGAGLSYSITDNWQLLGQGVLTSRRVGHVPATEQLLFGLRYKLGHA